MFLRWFLSLFLIALVSLPNLHCYRMRASKGGGQVRTISERKIAPADIALPPGYKIEAIASGLTFPAAVAFDDSGHVYAIEAGYSYGEVWTDPQLLRIDGDGKTKVVAKGSRNGPWTGITWHNGAFYVAEGGEAEGGRILRIGKDGTITPLLSNLPSVGDHHTNGPVVKDGYIYFGQGTATNSGVVGADNADFGWLKRKRDFHDIPCRDITLIGQNYTSENPLVDSTSTVTTGAFVPFGTSTTPGQVIKGALPCTGSILRIPVNGGPVELVAWGLRNPFGLAAAPDGRLFVTENGYDGRGSRPVWGSGDVLWEIKQDIWYGWPDFSAGKPLQGDEEFKKPESKAVKPLLQHYPNTPPKPAAIFGVHSSSNGLDFSRSDAFGYKGEAFVAQFGDMAPKAGKVLAPVGYKIVRVNVDNGVIRDFAVNKGKRNGPASWLGGGGLERPVSVAFDPSGTALYVADFGIMHLSKTATTPKQQTGVIWKISKQ
jgi:glucose/arabinose dehydrogenase